METSCMLLGLPCFNDLNKVSLPFHSIPFQHFSLSITVFILTKGNFRNRSSILSYKLLYKAKICHGFALLLCLQYSSCNSPIGSCDYCPNRIYNKILDRDWFSASLFVTLPARDHVGVQLQVSDLNFF